MFFKYAAKSILPILGAIALPINAKDFLNGGGNETPQSCNGNCTGLCTTTCTNGCK